MSTVHWLGENLKRIRDERGLSQLALATASGVSRSTLAGIEGARYASVDTLTIERIASALGLRVSQLIDRPARPKSEAPRATETDHPKE